MQLEIKISAKGRQLDDHLIRYHVTKLYTELPASRVATASVEGKRQNNKVSYGMHSSFALIVIRYTKLTRG